MSESGIKRLEAWAQVGVIAVMIILHAIAVESRLAKVEQKVDDLKEFIAHGK
jgi:hypothetical protein